MIGILLMFAVGMFLSAFFSGSETGFYRVTRVRLALDGLSGDPIARGLLWLTNNPTVFVATTLIGNNLANYLASRAIVLGSQHYLDKSQVAGEILVPILVSPFVFVYGELLPKSLFFRAPNRLLRLGGPLFLLCAVLFAPVAAVLWLLGRFLQSLVGEAPEILRLRLARTELKRVLDEGHEAGILRASQRALSQAVFDVANDAISRYSTSLSRMPCVRYDAGRADVLRSARRHRTPTLLVTRDSPRDLVGYIRVIDLQLSSEDWRSLVQPFMEIGQNEAYLTTLVRMQTHHERLARVVDAQGRTVGVVVVEQLVDALFPAD